MENLKQTHNSIPRNPVVANVCFKGSYIDAWGRGTLKILDACQEAGLPEPRIEEMDGGLLVILSKVEGGVIGGVIEKLTDRQIQILSLIHGNNLQGGGS